MSLTPSTKLGPYEIVSSIGAGGMGEVYKARDTRLNRNVALKTLPESFVTDGDRLRRFTLEAQSAGSLNDPNILAIHDIGTHNGTPYIVSELLEGETLRDRLNSGHLTLSRAVDYARQIASGLAAAHSKGITHRDIKPENIFITKDGRVKILDFGLAKSQSESANPDGITGTIRAHTDPGTVMGTVGYMAPEQVRGQCADARSDIFSFGAVLYEMLSGRRAFQHDTAVETMTAILKEEPPDLCASVPSLPSNVERLVHHCLEKNPDERFQSARDIAFDLGSITSQPSQTHLVIPEKLPRKLSFSWPLAAVIALLVIALATVAYLRFPAAQPISPQRLTFRRGWISQARFTPDGDGVVYSAQYESEPSDLFTARFDNPGSRSLTMPKMEMLAISRGGEIALKQNPRITSSAFSLPGMLAQVSLSGGAPRPILQNVSFADWSPNGKELAIVRVSEAGSDLEYPLGTLLYHTTGYVSSPRISPDGNQVAFLDHPLASDTQGTVAIVSRTGPKSKRTLTQEYSGAEGLAWSRDGKEIWFSAAKTGSRLAIRATTLSGQERLIYSAPVSMELQDIFRDGRVLITTVDSRCRLIFRGAADAHERDLSWLDWSLLSSLSNDGKQVTFFESGEGAGDATLSFIRETSGAPAVSLGPGLFPVLSPDGQSVVTVEADAAGISILPVGPGQSQRVSFPGYKISSAGLLPDGKRIWLNATQPSHSRRYFVANSDGTGIHPITPEGVRISGVALTPDGKYLAGISKGIYNLYPIDGGSPSALNQVTVQDRIAGWTADGQAVFVYSRNGFPSPVQRVDLHTGKRDLLREITPADLAGLTGLNALRITEDGNAYAYSVVQQLSELQLLDGLK